VLAVAQAPYQPLQPLAMHETVSVHSVPLVGDQHISRSLPTAPVIFRISYQYYM
jgi:hypothetical protein